MLVPFAVALAALVQPPAPAPAAGLTLSNVRTTFGNLGGPRPAAPLVPGDVLFLAFDIDGVSVDDKSKAGYVMGMEVADRTGKVIYKQDPAAKADFVPLGGGRLPGQAFISIGLEQPPGEYTMKVTVADGTSKATQTLTHRFTVAPKDFAVVGVFASVDERGAIPAPTTGVVGQAPFINLGVVGFARGADKQPNVTVEMLTLDEAGKPTSAAPHPYTVNKVAEAEPGILFRFLLPFTRPGKFTVRFKATDAVANKTATFDLPVTVLSPAN